MRKYIIISLLLFPLVGVFVVRGADRGSAEVLDAEKERKVYTCPMHPEIREKEPGLCRICGMSLLPVAATEKEKKSPQKEPMRGHPHEHRMQKESTSMKKHPEPSTEHTLEMDEPEGELYTCPMHPQILKKEPGQCPICGMTLVPVKKQEALPESSVDGFATVRITPEQQWLIGVQTTKVVQKNLTRRLRTYGTVASDPNLYVAQKEYIEALKTASRSLIQAARRKLTLLGMTEVQIDKLGRKGEIDESLYLTEGTGKAWIYSVIYESEYPLIREGLKVEVQAVGHPQMTYTGKIDAILPVVDPLTRTMTIRTVVDDPIGLLKPDMFTDVYIEIPLGKTFTIPRSAILKTGRRNIVMVDRGNGIFEPREVVLGNQSDEEYQIISGLKEGESVVTSANFLIDSESQIRGAFSSSRGGEHHGH